MSAIPRFAAYAAAFEKAYESDDWQPLEPFFHEDAVYEVGLAPPIGGRFAGRDAIFAYFKRVLDGFDRRFATRTIKLLDGPTEEDGAVRIRGSATYTATGVPDLTFELEEIATFEGDRIRRLEDRYDEATAKAMGDYLEAHADALGLAR